MALAALVAVPARAETFAQRAAPYRSTRVPANLAVLAPAPDKPAWHVWLEPEVEARLGPRDLDALVRLGVEGQTKVLVCPPAVGRGLAPAADWDRQPGWMLLSDQGEALAQGPGRPKDEVILELFRTLGNPPAWESRARHLRAQPADGTVWDLDLLFAGELARMRLRRLRAAGRVVSFSPELGSCQRFTDEDPQARAECADWVFRESAAALEGLVQVPGWTECLADLNLPALAMMGGEQAPCVRKVAAAMLEDLDQACRQEQGSSLFLWPQIVLLAGAPPSRLPTPPLAMPGQAWPPHDMILAGCFFYRLRKDWAGTLAFLAAAAAQATPGPDSGAEGATLAAHLAMARVKPLIELGQPGEAMAALQAARSQGQAAYQEAAKYGLNDVDMDEPALPQDLRAALHAPDPPPRTRPAPPPPLRLVLGGQPAWAPQWAALRRSDPFLPWAPAELAWEAEAAAASGWELRRGNEVLARGGTCPAPAYLAGLVAAQALPMLSRLDAVLERQPDHRTARRARLDLLLARMPERRLESRLADDARILGWGQPFDRKTCPVQFGPKAAWRPDPALWQWAAQETLPRLEARLRSWPGHGTYLLAWVAWSRFHPRHPSLMALVRDLIPEARQEAWFRLMPLPTIQAIAEILARDGDDAALAEWLGARWAVEKGWEPNPGMTYDAGLLEFTLNALRRAVVQPLQRSLRTLGRPREADTIDQEFTRLKLRTQAANLTQE